MAKYTYNPPYNQWSGNRSDTLNKWKINYKGSIATASVLPDKGEFKGDTYNVLEDGSNYMWNGTSWDKLDANTYIGATSEANGIRGLVPPATTAQMYSLLTGSGVWKSGAELGFAYDNAVVHLTGDETIGGNKTLTGVYDLIRTFPVFSITNTDTSAGNYCDIRFFHDTLSNRKALIRYSVDGTLSICCAHNSSDTYLNGPGIFLIADGSVKITSKNASNTKDLFAKADGTLTWDSKDITGDVHTTGNETIGGEKTFNDVIWIKRNGPFIQGVNTTITSGTTPTAIKHLFSLSGRDSNEEEFSYVSSFVNENGNTVVRLSARIFDKSKEKTIVELWSSRNEDSFNPAYTNSVILGTTNFKWKEIWCNQSSINSSSDERLKQSISSIPDEILDAWEYINWIQFKYKDAVKEKGLNKARIHNGLIAQDVDRLFKSKNLDISKYGLFLYDEWEETQEEKDENGNIIQEFRQAGNEYGLRYTEALCMEAAYQRRENVRLKKRIASLEARIEALEAKLA